MKLCDLFILGKLITANAYWLLLGLYHSQQLAWIIQFYEEEQACHQLHQWAPQKRYGTKITFTVGLLLGKRAYYYARTHKHIDRPITYYVEICDFLGSLEFLINTNTHSCKNLVQLCGCNTTDARKALVNKKTNEAIDPLNKFLLKHIPTNGQPWARLTHTQNFLNVIFVVFGIGKLTNNAHGMISKHYLTIICCNKQFRPIIVVASPISPSPMMHSVIHCRWKNYKRGQPAAAIVVVAETITIALYSGMAGSFVAS